MANGRKTEDLRVQIKQPLAHPIVIFQRGLQGAMAMDVVANGSEPLENGLPYCLPYPAQRQRFALPVGGTDYIEVRGAREGKSRGLLLSSRTVPNTVYRCQLYDRALAEDEIQALPPFKLQNDIVVRAVFTFNLQTRQLSPDDSLSSSPEQIDPKFAGANFCGEAAHIRSRCQLRGLKTAEAVIFGRPGQTSTCITAVSSTNLWSFKCLYCAGPIGAVNNVDDSNGFKICDAADDRDLICVLHTESIAGDYPAVLRDAATRASNPCNWQGTAQDGERPGRTGAALASYMQWPISLGAAHLETLTLDVYKNSHTTPGDSDATSYHSRRP
ncbi:hypothetical protein BKA93DRAFT_749018 [Sparassis latifolia]